MGLLRIAESLPRPLRRALRRLPGVTRLRRALAGTPRGPRPASGSLRPVVYLPTWARWDQMRQRPQYLVAAFAAAGHPAFFVDPRATTAYEVDGVRIVPTLRHVPGSDVLLYVHFAPLRTMFDRFHDPVVVYDVLDDLSIYEPDEVGLSEHRRVRAHHPEVLASADVAMASSRVLLDRHRAHRPDLLLVENGVDVARFRQPSARPTDVPTGRPVVGYHGAIARWFDFSLIRSVALANPQWDFVLVGPVLAEVAGPAGELASVSNIHLLGERSSDDVVSYVHAFDVGVLWFVVDDLTRGVSPLKMFEYLAAGVPSVATPIPACVGVAGVQVAATAEEMTAAISRALESGTEDARALRASAEAASWGSRLAPVLQRLDERGLRTVRR